MSLFKQCNFKTEVMEDGSLWSLAFHETISQAKSWVGSCPSYKITEVLTNNVVEQGTWPEKEAGVG